MSIITEALKKAERDRAVRARNATTFAQGAIAVDTAMESEQLVRSFLRERERRLNEVARPARLTVERPSSSPTTLAIRTQGTILIFFGVVCVIVLVSYAHARWFASSEQPSVIWNPTEVQAESKEAAESLEIDERPISPKPSEIASEAPQIQLPPEPVAKSISVRVPAQIPFVLSGVSVWGAERYAFINGQIVTVGDWVDGAFVKEILDHEAIIESRAGEIKLKLLS